MINKLSIARERIQRQRLCENTFNKSSDVVSWFGAVQAQDFAAAKWALSIRMNGAKEVEIEHDFNNGLLLRTHILRPTWHLVHPRDIRWMLALTSPRVLAYNGYYYRQAGLDKTIFQKSNEVIRKALEGGKQLTRQELDVELQQAKIPTQNLGLSFTIMQAELDGIICSGPRRLKQFTYMLLDERVPKTGEITRDEALGNLTMRFFQSHGPAQIKDFIWWSSLPMSDAKKGIEIAKLEKEIIDDKTYWFTERGKQSKSQTAYLLPPFDEYIVAYKDRSDILNNVYKKYMNFGGGMITGAIIINGIVVGIWKRAFQKGNIIISLQPFIELTDIEYDSVKKAGDTYGRFLGMPVTIKE